MDKTEELYRLGLPVRLAEELDGRIQSRKALWQREELSLIGAADFEPPDPSVVHDAVVALALGKNILLKGPTGAGKTKFAEYLSGLFAQPLHSVNCSVDLDAESLLGFKTLDVKDGQSAVRFVPGPFIKAMEGGHLLYIDEVNIAKPETLPLINGVLDYRRKITNPFTSEVVRAKEGFNVIAAVNIGYVGTVPMNEALKNRFVVIDVPYLQGDKLLDLLKRQSLQKDEELLQRFVQLSADLIAQTRMGQLSDEAASIRSLLDACDLSVYLPPLRAVQRAIVDKLEDEREQAAAGNVAETLF